MPEKEREDWMREALKNTNLFIRNFGRGRSRIMLIEPKELTEYDPIRLKGCSVILFNASVIPELVTFYQQADTRAQRTKIIPGGIGSSADESMKKYLRQFE